MIEQKDYWSEKEPNAEMPIPAKTHKPVHGGYPDFVARQESDAETKAARKALDDGENLDVMAAIFGQAPPTRSGPPTVAHRLKSDEVKPPVYFDGLKLWHVLNRRANAAHEASVGVKDALRAVQNAVSESDVRLAVSKLTSLIHLIMTSEEGKDLRIALSVDELATAIDNIAPPEPRGYVPHMGLHYAVKPLRSIIDKMRLYLAITQG